MNVFLDGFFDIRSVFENKKDTLLRRYSRKEVFTLQDSTQLHIP